MVISDFRLTDSLVDSVELKARTRKFSLDIIGMVDGLHRDRVADHLGRQLLRSATSVGANYRAACRSRSDREMAAKLGIVLEEADESAFWLELLVDSGRVQVTEVALLRDECEELIKIFAASIMTIRKRLAIKEELSTYTTSDLDQDSAI